MATPDVLAAHHELEYTYTRSTGPVVGTFLAGLRDKRIFGVRASDGRVLVPPADYDPVTSETLDRDAMVEVGQEGVVTTWSWCAKPREGQPLDHPFAWVLVRLDGADTPLLHALDVASPDEIRTGARVRARWAGERAGSIRDLACFEVVA